MSEYNYGFLNSIISASPVPSRFHLDKNEAFGFFRSILFEKALSVIEFNNFPDIWDKNYFLYVLFASGYIGVFKNPEFGPIVQQCTLEGFTIYYQPKKFRVANPYLPPELNRSYEIDKDGCLLRLRPSLKGIMEIVDFYAAKMAILSQTFDVNAFNAKTPALFEVATGKMAKTLKAMYDKIAMGDPFILANKTLTDGAGKSIVSDTFSGKNYMGSAFLDDLISIENEFNSRVGIPSVNSDKKERLITSEMGASLENSSALSVVMIDTLKTDIEKLNAFAGTNIAVKLHYEQEPTPAPVGEEGPDNDE